MFHPGSLVVAASVLLLGTDVLAQTQGSKQWKRVERSVSLDAGSDTSDQKLRLAPNVVTTVLFDTEIAPDTVDLAGLRALFSRLELQERLLVLKPAVAIPAKGVPPLVVHFADGSAPRRVVFVLTTDASEVDSVVDVLRQPATAEQLEAQLVALRIRYAALEERLAAARRPALSRGLASALLSGAIDSAGVTRRTVKANEYIPKGLLVEKLHAYRSSQWLALHMTLENPADAPPWVPGLARLTRLDAGGVPFGEALEAPVNLREARLAPGQSAAAVAQWPLPADGATAAYALEVLDVSGRRGVEWEKLEL